jgi:hypothetical protein
MHELPLAAIRQVQIAHAHVTRVEASALVVAVTRLAIAVLSAILIAVARVVLCRVVANLGRARPASQDEPFLLPVVNAIVPIT